ncbi:DUF3179 domain-containing protein [Flavobacteriaceae bacterium S0825]|uniref:DUF3179 domain-containing (seleno)protein n=1 Tax=Gaetbulibacter sp. S0825 TaxID=2720084 RepID=UPI00142FA2E8|nr:DUF3179 domain-containing (seleno)protein [Gaetbulibacter sp. S0825]MCK0108707.1 DUF3179 domain-containing protein [Flavobacteriaceae bacterium S0825]NIX64343.1 DUF3179 domain-containing protein [Gaetbulibacter sp. S0825]
MQKLTTLLILIVLVGCSKNNPGTEKIVEENEWLVNKDDLSGSFAMYPLGDNPEYTTVANIDLPNSERVGVMSFGDEVRVYPYPNTFATEIINDQYQSQKYAFTYCPITKSALAYTRSKTLRASGYLYKNNMVPWDEDTETLWSQMLIRGIKGNRINQRLKTLAVVETRWETIKNYFPNARVLKNIVPSSSRINTSSKTSKSNLRTTNIPDERDYVYGVLDEDDNVTIYQYDDFTSQNRYDITLRQYSYIVYGNKSHQIISAFEVDDFNNYQTLDESEFPYVLQDLNGIKYNVLGVGTNGETLEKPKYAYVAAWWAFDDFFTNFTFQE